MTQNDPLRALFSLPPVIVGAIVLVAGWGSLLLIAWRTHSVTTILLRSAGFMVGDLVLLPISVLLITRFYQRADNSSARVTSRKVTYLAVVLATLSTAAATAYSTLVSENYNGVWSAPHTVFIWFFAYVMIVFLFKGLRHLSSRPTSRVCLYYLGVVLAVSAHIILKLVTGPSSFPS